MHFNKLRLAGFKSFVDATELDIAPGLTGIVGPNGCGKSNLVEALRWVMGETSAKQMRGGGMEDVIFGGTTDRPSRNIAEVALQMDNSDRTAPAQFNENDELEVSRRIEREKGSNYRVNGHDVRARDVQILFADQATGPRSTALVSQGRVAAVIGAKPTDRRMLLEEAAGITGLHSRRHEAELRLRAAETNLERLDDVLMTLDAQLQGLKKQVRQARRYRNISQDIRKTEAVVLYRRWTLASDDVATAKTEHETVSTVVTERTRAVAQATTQREEAAQAVVPLREAEASAAAELQRLTHAREELDAEERRIAQAIEQWSTRRAQIEADLDRERGLVTEAEAALSRMRSERSEIEQASADEAQMIAAAAQSLDGARARMSAAEAEVTRLTEAVANAEAGLAAIERELAELNARDGRMRQQYNDAVAERDALTAEGLDPAILKTAEVELDSAEQALEEARGAFETAEQARSTAEAERERRRDARNAADETRSRLHAEATALRELLADDQDGEDGNWTPLLDTISVQPGYEAALGTALGDDLDAPADEAAPRHWRLFSSAGDAPRLPEGAQPLSEFVGNSGPLARRLAQIGLVADAEAGDRLSRQLQTGQRLVDRDGNLWRWDGFVARAQSRSSASARLSQRNRLDELEGRIADADSRFAEADSAYQQAHSAAEAAIDAERKAREAVRSADAGVTRAREQQSTLSRELSAKSTRLETLNELTGRLQTELQEIADRSTAVRDQRQQIGQLDDMRDTAAAARAQLSEARSALHAAEVEHDQLQREAEQRQRRIAAIAAEERSWQARHDGAAARVEELQTRDSEATRELESLSARPADIERQRASLMDVLTQAEQARRAAGDRVAEAETVLGEADKALREAESALAQTREDMVRAESLVAQAEQAQTVVRERIAERLECRPEEVLEQAEIPENREVPDLESSEKRLERLLRERDNMGPVNLRAEQEAEELEEKIATVQSEREDLVSAISRLRQGIANLNREARQRLLASFEEVQKHFQHLFTRLFGGGQARLALTDSDDPLEAGLEIFASPPGKKMQILSLLSGGEQALTAIALLFGVFMTNPAPICVLDEVDAPLDDANVDRFCTLLDEIAHSGTTRFLVVTHHRMTMARMDRLYGVTMQERGVSQLVSVDLGQAEELRATA